MSRNASFAEATTYQADLEPVTAHVASQYHAANGGSSFHAWGGARATEGYAVGGMKAVPEHAHPHSHLSPEQFQAHRDRVRHGLRDASPVEKHTAVAGTWLREHDGHSVTDASNVTPDREFAKHLQHTRNEDAVWNLSENREENLR